MRQTKGKPPKGAAPQQDDSEQSRLFIEKAREIDADEKRSNADALLKCLASKPPEPRK